MKILSTIDSLCCSMKIPRRFAPQIKRTNRFVKAVRKSRRDADSGRLRFSTDTRVLVGVPQIGEIDQ
jgi:hypothetical protein